jgi:hypothetical protein
MPSEVSVPWQVTRWWLAEQEPLVAKKGHYHRDTRAAYN